MAEVSAAAQLRYRKALRGIQSDAQTYMSRRLAAETRGLPVEEARDKAIDILRDCNSVFGDRAQAISSELFDEVCQAEGIDAGSQIFDDVIDDGLLQEKVRYYARYLASDPPDRLSFQRMVSQLGGYYARRSAYSNTMLNCERNKVRYARVPGGGETCTFCMMLAGRGFVYVSEKTAAGHQYHSHCDCVAMPGKKGSTAIYGYDPGACRRLSDKFLEIDGNDRLTGRQKDAIKASWSAALMGEDTAGLRCNPTDLADVLGIGFSDAKKQFVADGKTANAYQTDVSDYLRAICEPFGKTLTGQVLPAKNGRVRVALPDGDELWAALHMPGERIEIIATTSETCAPDFLLDGRPVELKTPRSISAVRKRLRHAEDQFVRYPGADKNVYISTLRIGDGMAEDIEKIASGFVKDGVLDSVTMLTAMK